MRTASEISTEPSQFASPYTISDCVGFVVGSVVEVSVVVSVVVVGSVVEVDSPSGTALELANAIQKANNNKYFYELNRLQKHEKRNPNEIGFSSIRGGNIIGKHSVIFFNENESFEVKHTAYSRSIFAEGALKAAEFIVSQPAGYYVSSGTFL